MTIEDTRQQVSRSLAGPCLEPIGAALIVHRGPETATVVAILVRATAGGQRIVPGPADRSAMR